MEAAYGETPCVPPHAASTRTVQELFPVMTTGAAVYGLQYGLPLLPPLLSFLRHVGGKVVMVLANGFAPFVAGFRHNGVATVSMNRIEVGCHLFTSS